MMNGWDNGMSTGGWVLMVVLWIVLIAAIVWAIARLLPSRRTDASGQNPAVTEMPKAILDRRLARGEIDTATYDALREKLDADVTSGGV